MTELLTPWRNALAAFGVSIDVADRACANLAARYAEPQRHYHTQAHLAAVIRGLWKARTLTLDLPTLLLAAFFHDVVYDSRRSDNEEQSAAHADTVLRDLGVPEDARRRIGELILLTQHSTPPADAEGSLKQDIDACLLLDADLAILGAPPPDYDRYAAQVRQEYAWVPEAEFRSGRAAVLRQFLVRPRLFHTNLFLDLEDQARSNLAREISMLENEQASLNQAEASLPRERGE